MTLSIPITRPGFLTVAACLLLSLTGCEQGVDWSPQEKENARHIFRSMDAMSRAATRANELPPRWSPDDPAVERVRNHLTDAIIQAGMVRDEVLVKAHPDLYNRFRGHYEPALKELLRYYRGELDKTDAARRLSEFSRWYSRRQYEFRWWPERKKAVSDR